MAIWTYTNKRQFEHGIAILHLLRERGLIEYWTIALGQIEIRLA